MTPQEKLKEIEDLNFLPIDDEKTWLIARVKQLEKALEDMTHHICLGLVITPESINNSPIAKKARKALEGEEL